MKSITDENMALFFIGILEMLVIAVWTSLVSQTKVLASGLVSFINIIIWYYVMQAIIADIGNWRLALIYAAGCSLGTMLGTYLSSWSAREWKKIGRLGQLFKSKIYARRDT